MNITLSAPASTLFVSFLSVAGVLLIILGWNYGTLFKPASSEDALKRQKFNKQEVSQQEFVRRLFGEAAYRYYRRIDANKEEELWNTLDLIGYPQGFRSPADFYMAKFTYASAGLLIGIAATVIGILVFRLPPFIVIATLLTTLIGFFLPDLQLSSLVQRRIEQIIYEIPEVMGELTIYFASSNSLPQAINSLIEETAGSFGYLYRELFRVRERYRSGIPLEEALEEMMMRNKDVPVLSRIIQRLIFAQVNGLPLLETLSQAAENAWEILDNQISERFERNKRLIMGISFLFIISTLIISFAIAFSVFSSFSIYQVF